MAESSSQDSQQSFDINTVHEDNREHVRDVLAKGKQIAPYYSDSVLFELYKRYYQSDTLFYNELNIISKRRAADKAAQNTDQSQWQTVGKDKGGRAQRNRKYDFLEDKKLIWRATNWDKEEAKDRRGGTRGNNHNQDDNRAGRRDNQDQGQNRGGRRDNRDYGEYKGNRNNRDNYEENGNQNRQHYAKKESTKYKLKDQNDRIDTKTSKYAEKKFSQDNNQQQKQKPVTKYAQKSSIKSTESAQKGKQTQTKTQTQQKSQTTNVKQTKQTKQNTKQADKNLEKETPKQTKPVTQNKKQQKLPQKQKQKPAVQEPEKPTPQRQTKKKYEQKKVQSQKQEQSSKPTKTEQPVQSQKPAPVKTQQKPQSTATTVTKTQTVKQVKKQSATQPAPANTNNKDKNFAQACEKYPKILKFVKPGQRIQKVSYVWDNKSINDVKVHVPLA